MDWQIGNGLVMDFGWIDNRLTDWQRIGDGLTMDLQIGKGLAYQSGLATDWGWVGNGLARWQRIGDGLTMD